MALRFDMDSVDEVIDVAMELDGWAELVLAAGRSQDVTQDAYCLVSKGLERAAERLRAACGTAKPSAGLDREDGDDD